MVAARPRRESQAILSGKPPIFHRLRKIAKIHKVRVTRTIRRVRLPRMRFIGIGACIVTAEIPLSITREILP